jgi:hypothetical protein
MARGKSILLTYFLFFSLLSISAQTLTGIVLDQKTNLPIESAAVYFDGTSIGTSTTADGAFMIDLVQGVSAPLVISYLGYQKQILYNYTSDKRYKILMSEDLNSLDEVIISADDGLPREIKLQQFRKEFLGTSINGLSSKISNEDDLILWFDAKRNRLSVSSKKPIQIVGKNLRYVITFDLDDFVINYQRVDLLKRWFGNSTVAYQGTSFYTDLDTKTKNRTFKKRDQAYHGSVMHFMRALSRERLAEESYQIAKGGILVPANELIAIARDENSATVLVTVTERLNIIYDKYRQSVMEVKGDTFKIDQFGNHSPIKNVLFGGDMGEQRVGDALPLDYGLNKKK